MDNLGACWSGRVVVVTGGGGFLGRHLISNLLGFGAEVLCIERKSAMASSADLLTNDRLHRKTCGLDDQVFREACANADMVYHLAATSISNAMPADMLEAENVEATKNVVSAIRSAKIPPPIILASTDRVYAPSCGLPLTEDSELGPVGAYARSKLKSEEVVVEACQDSKFGSCILRFSNIYGPGDKCSLRIVPSILESVATGQPFYLKNDGSARRDFLFVTDAVAALTAAGGKMIQASRPNKIYNVGSGVGTSTLELARLALESAGRPDLKINLGDESDVSSYLDCEMIARELGWRARVPIAHGLQRTWKSIRLQ